MAMGTAFNFQVRTAQVAEDMVSGFDSSKVRPHQVLTIAYDGQSITLDVSVRPKIKQDEAEVPRCG